MIPVTVVSTSNLQDRREVFCALSFPDVVQADGLTVAYCVVTTPGTGRPATLEALTYDGEAWMFNPGSVKGEFSGWRDACRDIITRSGLSRHQSV